MELLIESLAAGESDLHPHGAEIDNTDIAFALVQVPRSSTTVVPKRTTGPWRWMRLVLY